MRVVLVILLVLVSVNVSIAADLGSSREIIKNPIPVWSGQVAAFGGEDPPPCGEDMSSACTIASLPFTTSGNTCSFVDDYDVACPFTGSSSADVVYAFTPDSDMEISVDLCANGEITYDTKTYIVDAGFNLIACNDDFYEDGTCGNNASYIGSANLSGGTTYYIIVDGYGLDCGPYFLEVAEVIPVDPCVVSSPDPDNEGEPLLEDGYADLFNSGCAIDPDPPFLELLGHAETGELEFYGKSGWYTTLMVQFRDIDWFTVVFNESGIINWEVTAEQRMTMYRITPGDCTDIHVIAQATVLPCVPQTLELTGSPGEVAWLWMGPEAYSPPAGFSGHEFNYLMHFDGMFGTPAEASTWGSVKAMYR